MSIPANEQETTVVFERNTDDVNPTGLPVGMSMQTVTKLLNSLMAVTGTRQKPILTSVQEYNYMWQVNILPHFLCMGKIKVIT